MGIPPGGYGLQFSPLLSNTVLLSSAQILALFTTPVTLVPAQGPGLTINVMQLIVRYNFGTTAYLSGGSITLTINGTAILPNIASGTVLLQAISRVYFSPSGVQGNVAANESTFDNQPFIMQNITGAFTTGDGTLK